jgi:hypothetical protein
MKIVSQRFLFIVFSTLCSAMAFAQDCGGVDQPACCGGVDQPACPPGPPTPGPPPPPPGLPIDENIMILVVIALLFGIYIIYKHSVKRKDLNLD